MVGTEVPTIRHLTQTLAQKTNACAIRINPREPEISSPNIGIALGALEGLTAMDRGLF